MWNKIYFNRQNIKGYTRNGAAIIQLPNKSEYKGCVIFHPSKLVREEGHKGYMYSLSFTDDWEFKVYKDKENIDTIGIDEIKDVFQNNFYDNEGDGSPSPADKAYLIVEEPKKIEGDVNVDESLLR